MDQIFSNTNLTVNQLIEKIDLEYSIHRDIATDRNKCYYYLITNMYDDGVEKWNEYLEEHKQPKLIFHHK